MNSNLNLEATTSFNFANATPADIDELLALYFTVYGKDYPLSLGTDRKVMKSLIDHPDHLWLLARENTKNKIVASIVVEVDIANRLGRAEGLVVHSDFRNQGLASELIRRVCEPLVKSGGPLYSVYTTTRTVSIGPQVVFLRNGFLPLGIFPNAHRLKEYETLTFMAKFQPGVLDWRGPVRSIPTALAPIVGLMNDRLGIDENPELVEAEKIELLEVEADSELEFELIFAPSFVKRKFHATFTDPYDRFFPFHEPNLLMVSQNGEVDIYAHFSKSDGYCTIVALTQPCWKLAGRLNSLLKQLRAFGVSYLELLMGIDHTRSLQALLNAQFLPSAYYPAMLESHGCFQDFVLMTRTMEPLNFRNMKIEECFKPFVDQYVDLWKKMHLDVLGVFNDYQ